MTSQTSGTSTAGAETEQESAGRVLLADDDELVRSTLARALRRVGFEVDEAADGHQALAAVETQGFDVVVADVRMGELDGVSLLRKLRERDAELPVLLMTGSPEVSAAAAAVELRALRYLVKPVPVADLRRMLTEAIAEYRKVQRAREEEARVRTEEFELRGALDRAISTLVMHYQPVVLRPGDSVWAYEALARPGPNTFQGPGPLFDAASRLGRVVDVGRGVRERVAACALARPEFQLLINLHPLELLDDLLFDPTTPLSQVAPRVIIEVTERAALEHIPDCTERVRTLRSMGFRIAVDDLGSGYSGLMSVALLEPEVVKLDMSLVRDIHLAPTKQRLVNAMVDLFGKLDRVVIAEGVENIDEAQTLTQLGCRYFQGWHFGRPKVI
jgi:EAL domain-containing protein (putative c-di-GMP-specific phosphodiesterase class I)